VVGVAGWMASGAAFSRRCDGAGLGVHAGERYDGAVPTRGEGRYRLSLREFSNKLTGHKILGSLSSYGKTGSHAKTQTIRK
jgi:hypothetical protein